MKRNIFFLLLILLSVNGFAQHIPDSLIIPVTDVKHKLIIKSRSFVYTDTTVNASINDIVTKIFTKMSMLPKPGIKASMVNKPLYIAFTLHNNDSIGHNIFFFPGTSYKSLELYKQHAGRQPEKISQENTEPGFVRISMTTDETCTYIVRGRFARLTMNEMNAELIDPAFLKFYRLESEKTLVNKKVVGILLSGVLLLMILFTLVNFFLNGKIEFLYNCLYSICMFFLIFFTAVVTKDWGWFKLFFFSYFDLVLLIVGTYFYLFFTRSFLNTKHVHPKLDRFLAGEQWLLIVFTLLYTSAHYLQDSYVWENRLEDLIKIVILIASVIFVIAALVIRNRLITYVAIGTAIQVFLYIISFLMIHLNVDQSYIFTSPIIYFELGVVMAVFFFLLGLTYKNKTEIIERTKEQEAMKLEVEKKGFETQLAIIKAQQEERNRISADMHDDLGAGMTTIRLFSEIAKRKLGDTVVPEIDKISASANELLNKMNAIIWSMSSSNDSLGNMIAYIRTYAVEYLEEHNIEATIIIPPGIPDIEVQGKIRRNIFLVVKEALHNIVKHAEATMVTIEMKKYTDAYSVTIHDNGKGINFNDINSFGNGLRNMKKRMDDVGIRFDIKNEQGTSITMYREIKGSGSF